MQAKEYILQRLKQPWDTTNDNYSYWRATTETTLEEAKITVSQYCEMLRCSVGHMPRDVEEMLIDLITDYQYAVSTVCQMAARFATQEWLSQQADSPNKYEDSFSYSRERLKNFIERRKNATIQSE